MSTYNRFVLENTRILTDYAQKSPQACGVRLKSSFLAYIIRCSFPSYSMAPHREAIDYKYNFTVLQGWSIESFIFNKFEVSDKTSKLDCSEW